MDVSEATADLQLPEIWTLQDDQIVLNFVYKQVMTNQKIAWVDLVPIMNNVHKSNKRCNDRWSNQLDPTIIRGPWSPAEINMIYILREKQKLGWSMIQRYFIGKTGNSIKNYFNSSIKHRLDEYESGFQAEIQSRIQANLQTPTYLGYSENKTSQTMSSLEKSARQNNRKVEMKHLE